MSARQGSDARRVVTLYGKPGCHLCEEAEAALERLRRRYPHVLSRVDITTSEVLQSQYGTRIPVVVIDNVEIAAPLTGRDLERALASAAL